MPTPRTVTEALNSIYYTGCDSNYQGCTVGKLEAYMSYYKIDYILHIWTIYLISIIDYV